MILAFWVGPEESQRSFMCMKEAESGGEWNLRTCLSAAGFEYRRGAPRPEKGKEKHHTPESPKNTKNPALLTP